MKPFYLTVFLESMIVLSTIKTTFIMHHTILKDINKNKLCQTPILQPNS